MGQILDSFLIFGLREAASLLQCGRIFTMGEVAGLLRYLLQAEILQIRGKHVVIPRRGGVGRQEIF